MREPADGPGEDARLSGDDALPVRLHVDSHPATVLVAVAPEQVDAARAALGGVAASPTCARSAGGGIVLAADVPDEGEAARHVARLRAAGWAATVRPAGGGHLAAWLGWNHAVPIGRRLAVCPPWAESDDDLGAGRVVVEIDPGAAFGSGTHPSTRLLLALLDERIGGGESVLDVGCGTGVLSVSAARLGAGSVTAVDIDPVAVEATRANAARNGVGDRVTASATPAGDVRGDYDVILANIGAPTLVELQAALRARLSAGGWLGLSGLSPAQLSVVGAAYRWARVLATPTDDDWAALLLSP